LHAFCSSIIQFVAILHFDSKFESSFPNTELISPILLIL